MRERCAGIPAAREDLAHDDVGRGAASVRDGEHTADGEEEGEEDERCNAWHVPPIGEGVSSP